MGGHDMVRRLDRQENFLFGAENGQGYARQNMGPKLMNCCKPEQVGTTEHGKC